MIRFLYEFRDPRTFLTWGAFAGLVFLKLNDTIDWSWLFVCAPLWGSVLIAFAIGLYRDWRERG